MARFKLDEGDRVDVSMQPGAEFFLIEISHIHDGWSRRHFAARPGRTNQSYEERVSGWLGTTNDIDHTANGMWRVDSVSGATVEATRIE